MKVFWALIDFLRAYLPQFSFDSELVLRVLGNSKVLVIQEELDGRKSWNVHLGSIFDPVDDQEPHEPNLPLFQHHSRLQARDFGLKLEKLLGDPNLKTYLAKAEIHISKVLADVEKSGAKGQGAS